jgi:hypothetical protein
MMSCEWHTGLRVFSRKDNARLDFSNPCIQFLSMICKKEKKKKWRKVVGAYPTSIPNPD